MSKKPNEINQYKLILNFDVNRTIVMRDEVQNLSSEDIIKEEICKQAWGFLTEDENN